MTAAEGAEYLKEMKSPSSLKRVLEFEVPRERVEAEIDAIMQEIKREATLPGFRKGKAPMDMIKARFGETARKEAIDRLIPEAYEQALKKESLRPVMPAEIGGLTYGEQGPLSFSISIELFPKVEIRPYKGVQVKKQVQAVWPEDEERELKALRDRAARFEDVGGEAEPSHIAVLDYWRIGEDGNPVADSRVAGYPVEIGSANLVKEFNEGLVGAKAGDHKTIVVNYPADFPEESMRGKTVRFGVDVKEIKRKILPALDEEFAKMFQLDSVDALKAKLKQGIQSAREHEATSSAKGEILRKIVEESQFEVPEGLIEMALDSMVKSYIEDLEAHGRARPEDKDQEKLKEIRERIRPVAVNVVKEQFIVDEIAKRESLTAKDEEIEEILQAVAARGGISVEEARSRLAKSDEPSRWRRDIIRNKVLDFLYQNAEVQT